MATLTANQLHKKATENGMTNLPFSEWITLKNTEYAQYTNSIPQGTEKAMSFVEWEGKKQKDSLANNNNGNTENVFVSKLLLGVVLLGGAYLICRSLKSSKLD